MPSPVGHSLIGMAIGILYYLPKSKYSELIKSLSTYRKQLFFSVLLANSADVDYLPGLIVGDFNRYHQGMTHSFGWIGILLFFSGLYLWYSSASNCRKLLLFIFLCTFSHLLADFLGSDGRPPIGIQIFWPWSHGHYAATHSVFHQLHNLPS